MELEAALRTTGAVRDFEARPVPDDLLYRVLDTARFAPSGGNRQAWRVVVVRQPELRIRLRDLYLDGWYRYLAMGQAGLVPSAPLNDRAAEAKALEHADEIRAAAEAGPGGFAEHLDQAPALLVILANLGLLAAVDRDLDRYTFVGGASIYPFGWSILLAAHDAGLGGVMTTMLAAREDDVLRELQAPAGWAVAGAIALGYPKGQRATKLRRTPVVEFARVDSFDGPPFDAG